MKKLIICTLALVAVAGSSFAGSYAPAKECKPVVPVQFFKDTEFAIDLFYSFNDGKHQDNFRLQDFRVGPPRNRRTITVERNVPQLFHDGSGGGVALTMFFYRYVGVSVEGNWWKGFGERSGIVRGPRPVRGSVRLVEKDVAHQLTGNLILRYPIEFNCFGFAPYIFGGGGGLFGNQNCGFWDLGAGGEFRITPQVGIFSDWRWNFVRGDDRGSVKKRNDVRTVRAGVRFVF